MSPVVCTGHCHTEMLVSYEKLKYNSSAAVELVVAQYGCVCERLLVVFNMLCSFARL